VWLEALVIARALFVMLNRFSLRFLTYLKDWHFDTSMPVIELLIKVNLNLTVVCEVPLTWSSRRYTR
jgi:hypothetical protein